MEVRIFSSGPPPLMVPRNLLLVLFPRTIKSVERFPTYLAVRASISTAMLELSVPVILPTEVCNVHWC